MKKIKDKNNRGFSLNTVILAVSFIGILALLVLYLALSNFLMKTTDLRGKDSFYTAERALEEIRTGLGEDMGDAMSTAFIKVLETYNKDSDSKDVVLDEERQKEFKRLFASELKSLLQGTEENQYNVDHLRSYLDLNNSEKYDAAKETLIVTVPAGKNPVLEADETDGVLLKNLKVIYVDSRGYASIIETDIRLGIPEVQFPTPSTLPDLMNMIVVAGGGVVCEGDQVSTTTIQGSIYAGLLKGDDKPDQYTSIYVKPGASLEIQEGDKIVSGGEIKVGENGSFVSDSGVTLWAQGARVSEGNISLLGTTYFSDDLTVEAGKGSKVTISGNYYGYGSPESARAESCYNAKTLYTGWSDAALSSSIVINGKNTTMDLSGAEKLMLAGKSYVGTSKISSIEGKTNNDVLTGESLTVKGSQLAYLFPVELFKLGDKPLSGNPVSYDEYNASGLLLQSSSSPAVDWDTPVEAWGGKTLREIGVDSDNPVQTVFYNDNSSGGVVYFYLNFTDSAKASEFMDMYYNSSSSVKAGMDKYLSFYFGDTSGITVGDPAAYLRYVTNGNVLTYDGASDSGSLNAATDSSASEKLIQEQVNYQNTWYALNRKMITSVDLLNKKVEDSDKIAHDESDSTRSVFDNLVNEKEMVKYLSEKFRGTLRYDFKADTEDDGLTAIVYHNGESSTYQDKDGREVTVPGKNETLTINQSMADKLRLVVCTGDVRIEAGVHFKGIIMAKGRLTLGKGAKLETAPLEAAKVFQGVTDEQDISPKQFFWDGDKYVLGNTSSSDSGNGTGKISDEYELSDYVTYENWKKE